MITRRGFIGSAPALVVAATATVDTEKKYGALNAQGHHAHHKMTGEFLHVYIDGEDVTGRSRFADDRQGIVEIYVREEDEFRKWHGKGGYYVSRGVVRVHGDVRFAPGRPL